MGLALLASTLLLVMAACGSAASNNTTPPPPVPTVASFTPTSGVAGTVVVLTGTNFTGAIAVKFNGKAASAFSVDSATQITASVATGSSTGKISVTTSGGSASSTTNFTVLGLPTITSFTPTSGPAGTPVTITGTNFTGATSVKFNSTAASSFTVNSDTQITATVAAGSTTGKITVTTPNGSGQSASVFTVPAPAPTITALNPGSGPVGTAVVITGTNFSSVSTVKFNGTSAASFTVNSTTQITATVANGATTGKVTVTTASGTATSANNFTVTSSGATLDLSIEGLYLTQATQEYPNPIVPLVQNRSAWVRVFVKANQANTVAPQVKVDFKTGATTHTLTINAGGSSVPLSIDPENAGASWNAAVDQAWMLPSTQVTATVDPTNLIAEADETNNTFAQNLNVQFLKPWKVTLIPVHTPDGSLGKVLINGSRTANDWVDFAKRIHPVPDAIDVVVGSTMNSSQNVVNDVNVWKIILNELTAKRANDGVTDRYYYGALPTTYGSGIAGLGWIGAPAAIGWDANGSFAAVFAHEEGHNFNRPHSPCGGAPGPDPNYPYPGALIGVPGWDVFASSNNLKSAATYTDIMAYCSPQWISDYVYVSEYNYRFSSPIGDIVPDIQGNVVTGDGLLVWGRIVNGQVTLEPAFRIPANHSLATPGPYTWEARDAMGRVLASVPFSAPEVADGPDDSTLQMFSFVVPLKPEILAAMQTIHIRSGNQELARREVTDAADFQSAVHIQDAPDGATQIVWDADRYPVLMLRDAKTGEVRGFVRGGNAQIESAPREIVVHAPDGARSEVIRHRRVLE